MKVVSKTEGRLLALLQGIVSRAVIGQLLPLATAKEPGFTGFSGDGLALIADTLRVGMVSLLAREGGWRSGRQIRGEAVVSGRLWQRDAPRDLGIAFGPQTLAFLTWLAGGRPNDGGRPLQLELGQLTIGDKLLLFLTYEAFRETDVGQSLAGRMPFYKHELIWLFYPDDLAPSKYEPVLDFTPWVTSPGSLVIEVWEDRLARRWAEVEAEKPGIRLPASMRELCTAQQRILSAWLDAAEQYGRRDLARWYLRTLSHVATADAKSTDWTGNLHTNNLRLAERTELYQLALVLMQHADRLAAWEIAARGVGYFDEGYETSKLWKADWSRYEGDQLVARARELLRAATPLSSDTIREINS